MRDPELKTASSLRELAEKHPEDAELLKRAASELEGLVKRLDEMWQQYRWSND